MKASLTRFVTQISTAVGLLTVSAHKVFAQVFGQVPDIGGTGTADIRVKVTNVIQYLLTFLGLVALVIVVIAGIRIVINGSDDDARGKAIGSIKWALIGLLIIVLAKVIVTFVIETITK